MSSSTTSPEVRVRVPGRRLRLVLGVPRGVHHPDPYAERFVAALRVPLGARVLDLGCGAGTYGIAAAALGASRVVATDVVDRALACTRANALRNGVAEALELRAGSLFEPVRGERFDAIVATLPQLPAPGHLDLVARYGGRDGLRYLRALAARGPEHLAPGGRLYSLVTGWAGPEDVASLLRARGLRVRAVARVRRAFQPAEYDGYQRGPFAYLDAHARTRGGAPAYVRRGSWCYLRVVFLEASV